MYFGKRWTLLPIGSKNALRLRELDDVVPVFHNWGDRKGNSRKTLMRCVPFPSFVGQQVCKFDDNCFGAL